MPIKIIYKPFHEKFLRTFTEEEQTILLNKFFSYCDVRFSTLSERKFIAMCREVLAWEAE